MLPLSLSIVFPSFWQVRKIHELMEMSADKVKKYVHTDHVMDLCGITGMDILISAGMDKRIGMWDVKTNQVIHSLHAFAVCH